MTNHLDLTICNHYETNPVEMLFLVVKNNKGNVISDSITSTN
jgi:hypothetical protein